MLQEEVNRDTNDRVGCFTDSGTEPQFTRPWKNWQKYGKVMLSNHRGEGRGGNPFILPNVGVYDTVPASVFEDAARLDLATLADQ